MLRRNKSYIDRRGSVMRSLICTALTAALMHCNVTTTTAADDRPSPVKSPMTAEQVQEIQSSWAKHLGKPVVETNSIGMKMVLLPPGDFVMGIDEKTRYTQLRERMLKGHEWDQGTAKNGGLVIEMPAHRVRLTTPFYMSTCEVTIGQFRQFVKQSGYRTEADRGLAGWGWIFLEGNGRLKHLESLTVEKQNRS